MAAASESSEVTRGANAESTKHPFFGLLFKLDETNYARWSRTFFMSVKDHKKYILTEPKPKEKTWKYATWIKDNGMVCLDHE